ncbi:putative cystathionine gamma-lyase 2 isoform X2 [Nilaparvata lugens]|nr:putative cystathionine gamma-lyase 2 isoform X2 [Nilaparvata lugens]XP_039295542.1 putative cystathionine gamma-lyase 2 isoform X2 [Nilaparvata lugens]
MAATTDKSPAPLFQKPLDAKFATKACLVGQHPEQWGYNDAVPPICLASTYKQAEPGVAKFDYSRSGNPNRDLLEQCLASLDSAKYGLCFSSGLGTLTAVMSLLESGDHVLCVDDLYGGTFRYFKHIASRFKLESSFLDASDPEKFVASMQPNTKIIWLESPTNPLLKVWDIEKICQLAKAKSKDVIVIVDNTFLTPYFQRPLELGADIALYSVTKYLNGHSDVVMGSLACNNKELYERLKFIQNSSGIVPSPFDCFLVNRSLKTLHLRMNEHMRSGLEVARFLESHPDVQKVLHPGLPSHPHHQLALRQWSGCSGMVSFYHKYGLNESKKFLQSLKVFMLAESLGGYESLAELPSVMTHASVPAETRAVLGITDNFIRLSVGLSAVPDLIDDLDQALRGMTKN